MIIITGKIGENLGWLREAFRACKRAAEGMDYSMSSAALYKLACNW